MDQFIKQHGPIIIALGAGLAVGASGTIVYYKLSRNVRNDVAQLALKLERLCKDVKSLKTTIESIAQARRSKRGYYSVHASSGEDDDDYEEAIDDLTIRYRYSYYESMI